MTRSAVFGASAVVLAHAVLSRTAVAYSHVPPLSGAAIATAVAGWELPFRLASPDARPWRLDTALRYSYVEGKDSWFSRWGPSAVLRMPVTERFETHLEWFGTFSDGMTGA